MSDMTVEQFTRLQNRLKISEDARARCDREAEITLRDLTKVRQEIVASLGKGMDDPKKLDEAAKAATAEAKEVAQEIDNILSANGY